MMISSEEKKKKKNSKERHRVIMVALTCLTATHNYRLVGLVVKESASRAEGPGFESRLRRDFFGVESYQ